MVRAILTLVFLTSHVRADTLAESERKELHAYLAELRQGRPGSAAQVERLAALSFDRLLDVITSYTELKTPVEPHTHRAFQALLERLSREALSPWPMVSLYSEPFAQFLIRKTANDVLGKALFQRLLESETGRQAFDLCIRLAPSISLEHLASEKQSGRVELFDAWNRRLAISRESRPLPELDAKLQSIGKRFSLDLADAERESHLRFLSSWSILRDEYARNLKACLENKKEDLVLTGLAVQQKSPLFLDHNLKLIERWSNSPKVIEQALRNFAFDESQDHSATLRKLWATLPAEKTRSRYQCLFAMSVHPKGNDDIALSAVREQAFELFDVAMPILRRGDPSKAREAVKHVLFKAERGQEEALRLARDLRLQGFEEEALKIALDKASDQILRQTAMLYMDEAEGKYRLKLLPILALPQADLRLTAIRAFKEKKGLGAADLREIGPTLVKAALADPSMGHRQEAMYVLGCWKTQETLEFFRKVLCDHPAVNLNDGYYSDARYWQYRFRLMGLLGMANLDDKKAKEELLSIHAKGSPAEKMDVLLAFLDLGEVLEAAWDDLDHVEPRLVATAAQLIATHGDAAAKERLKKRFASSPLWQQFRHSGINDYNILRLTEGK